MSIITFFFLLRSVLFPSVDSAQLLSVFSALLTRTLTQTRYLLPSTHFIHGKLVAWICVNLWFSIFSPDTQLKDCMWDWRSSLRLDLAGELTHRGASWFSVLLVYYQVVMAPIVEWIFEHEVTASAAFISLIILNLTCWPSSFLLFTPFVISVPAQVHSENCERLVWIRRVQKYIIYLKVYICKIYLRVYKTMTCRIS